MIKGSGLTASFFLGHSALCPYGYCARRTHLKPMEGAATAELLL
jgi:hypothetical protein